MKEILALICKYVLLLNEIEISEAQKQTQWLGNLPATTEAIESTEKRLGTSLPNDYIEFLKITNGFPQIGTTSSTFLPIEKIDYLKNLDDDLIDIWGESMPKVAAELNRSILIGGLDEEQYILLIPPKNKKANWKCWKFASWIPGEHEFNSFTSYMKSELDFLQDEAKDLDSPKPKLVIDYSLRDAVFSSDWKTIYALSQKFIEDNKYDYGYFNGSPDLLKLMLLSSYHLNNQTAFITFLQNIKITSDNQYFINEILISKFIKNAEKKLAFSEDLKEFYQFNPQNNTIGLVEIDAIIKENNKTLLKPKNAVEKLNYQLSLLFSYGNSEAFINLYESNEGNINALNELNAAKVYAYLQNTVKVKASIANYQKVMSNIQPFEPYFCEQLLPFLK